MSPPIRDNAILDALVRLPQSPYERNVWRSIGTGKAPTNCWRSGGRWDDKTFDVLYTSEAKKGAIEERRFHLFMGQPIAPSKLKYVLYELSVLLQKVIALPDIPSLQAIGMDTRNYRKASYSNKDDEYPPSQAIAEACFFLGADGLLVPSARHESKNLVVFCEQDTKKEINIVANHGVIKF